MVSYWSLITGRGGGVQNQGHWEEILFCLEPQGAQGAPHTVMVSYWSLITGRGGGVQNQGHWEEILFCLEPLGAQAAPHTVMVSYWSLITGRGGGGGTEPGTLGGDPLLLVLIFMIRDKYTYIFLHQNTPFYAFISHILTFVRFPDFSWLGSGISFK